MFKVGDRVRIICPDECCEFRRGLIGTIESIDYNKVYVADIASWALSYKREHLEPIEDNKPLPLPG